MFGSFLIMSVLGRIAKGRGRPALAAVLLMPAAPASADDKAPFLPTPPPVVEGMLDLAAVGKGDHLVDLGSGDGRIVVAAAKRGATALGVELGPDLIRRAREAARFEGVEDRARFLRTDLFAAPIRNADVVTLYLLPAVNLRLRPRLLTELRPGTRIVSHAFAMGDWRPDAHRQVAGTNVYLWVVPAVAGGHWRLALADGRVARLEIEQRFQGVSGRLDGKPIADATLRGDRLRFTADGRTYRAVVAERILSPDPAAPAGVEAGWRADRMD